jgi:hypothetical protein
LVKGTKYEASMAVPLLLPVTGSNIILSALLIILLICAFRTASVV